MTMRLVATALAVVLSAGTVLAEECPDTSTEDSGARRRQAKKWFTKGEEAIKVNDDLAALKAYQCSLKFVPHGFTAFNIAQISERVGDVELAIASYQQYLVLVPDAKDAVDVNRKVDALKERLLQARQQERVAKAPRPVPPPPAVESPGVAAATVAPTDSAGDHPASTGDVSQASPGISYRTWAWVSYGGAAAFILGGVVTNLMSRSKMDTCRSKYAQNDRVGADSACSDAKPLAYTSYALFGLAGAAAAAGTFFVLRPTDSTELAMLPLPEGGLGVRWGGSF